MLGAEQLKRARPHTVVINVGRGPLIDEQALITALSNGQIRGAALDVFETEPLPQDSPLWSMRNVLLSPHNAGKHFVIVLLYSYQYHILQVYIHIQWCLCKSHCV
jgi:phosphoglycerate dehydrogenase-like enzyme